MFEPFRIKRSKRNWIHFLWNPDEDFSGFAIFQRSNETRWRGGKQGEDMLAIIGCLTVRDGNNSCDFVDAWHGLLSAVVVAHRSQRNGEHHGRVQT